MRAERSPATQMPNARLRERPELSVPRESADKRVYTPAAGPLATQVSAGGAFSLSATNNNTVTKLTAVLRHIRKLVGDGNATDRQLLHRFATQHEEAAFEMLVSH